MRPFVTRARTLPHFPRIYTIWHQELKDPFRRCDHALVLRITSCRGFVVGIWHSTGYTEDEAYGRMFSPVSR